MWAEAVSAVAITQNGHDAPPMQRTSGEAKNCKSTSLVSCPLFLGFLFSKIETQRVEMSLKISYHDLSNNELLM